MELDVKHKVLYAIYTEYQKDLPNLFSITPDALGIPQELFYIALQKLKNEGLLNDVNILYGDNTILDIYMGSVKMSSYGIRYVEAKLDIDHADSSENKLKKVAQKALSWGWDQFKDITVQYLANKF